MLIYYLTGYPPDGDTGGGGYGNRSLINAGRSLGHTIRIYSEEGTVPRFKTPTFLWLCDMNGRFSLEYLRNLTNNWHVPFIIQDDGYQNLCPQPTGEYRLCFQDMDPMEDWGPIPLDIWKCPEDQLYDCREVCRYRLMRALTDHCIASHSVSPMHGAIWANLFPALRGKQIIEQPQIDVDLFRPTYPPGTYNRITGTYLYVGTIAKGKGYLACCDYVDRQGGTLYTAGDIHHTIRPDQVRGYQGHVPHDRLPLLYSQCEYVIHLPEWQEPQSMVFTEALLCGCDVIVNDRVGAASYPWWGEYCKVDTYYIRGLQGRYHMFHYSRNDKGLRSRLRRSPAIFWEEVGKYL